MDSQIKKSSSNLSKWEFQPTPIATNQAHQLVTWLQQKNNTATPSSRELISIGPITAPSIKAHGPLSNNNIDPPSIKRLLGLTNRPIDRQTKVASTNTFNQLTPSVEKTLRIGEQLVIHSGELLFTCNDFHIPGPIDFKWQRIYRNSSNRDYGLGLGWLHPFSEHLLIEEQRIIYSCMDGRRIIFGQPNIGGSCINRCEGLVLQRQGQHSYRILGFDCASKLFRADGISKDLPLVELRDSLDNTISIDYKDGLPHKVVTSWGRALEYICENGQINEIHNTNAPKEQRKLAQYEFSDGLLTVAHDQYHALEKYQYKQQRLSQRTLASGKNYDFKWHEASQRYNTITTGEYRQSLSWQEKTFTAKLSDNENRQQLYRFNQRGQAVLIRNTEGGESKFFYDSYGHLCSETDALGNSCYYRSDNNGRPTRISDELGNCTHIRYDSNSQPALVTNALGQHWQQRYNKKDLLISEHDPLGNQWQYHYNNRHQLECLEDPEGGKTYLHWNSQFELVQVVTPNGLVNDYTYDYWGRITSIKVAGKIHESYSYNQHNRLEAATNAAGQKSEFTYSNAGELLSSSEYDGSITKYSYDQVGRLSTYTYSNGNELHFRYDSCDRLIEQESTAGIQRWSYNGNDQISTHWDEQKRQKTYIYDACQRLIEYRNMDLVTYIERDACGRINRQSTNSGDIISFHYDALARLTLTDNGYSSIRYQYDACGKISAEHHDTDCGDGHSLNHRYDKRGWRISSSSADQLVSYLYSPDGQLYGIDVNGESVLRCDWDDRGRDHEWIQGAIKTSMTYNTNSQLQQLQSFISADDQQLTSHYFDNQAPHYSAAQHLNVNYNTSANQQSQILPITQLGTPDKLDQRGNLTTELATENSAHDYLYHYNSWNQLISAECGDFKTYYRYDPLGRRIGKTTNHRKSMQSRNTNFKWNGNQLWAEIHESNSNKKQLHYIFHPQLLSPIAMRCDKSTFYYQLNHQQKPLQMVDAKGQLVWQAQYRGDGLFDGFLDAPQVSSPWRSSCDYYDSETKLLFDGRGYFSPRLERYIHNI